MAGGPDIWILGKEIRLQAGLFTFDGHEYQRQLLRLRPKRRCVMKGTQGGFTEIEVLDSLWSMIYKLLIQGVLYLFPTSDDVDDFGKSRFNPLIATNRLAIGKYVKATGKKGTDTARLKKIHEAFLYLRGARLSQKISDLNESSKLKSIPVDRVVFDEIDHMDDEVVGKARGRMGHSRIQEERYLSNPLVPGQGIDKLFTKSDQRHWFRSCSCGEWTCAELYFMDDPEACVGIRKDGTGFISCKKCGKEVFIRDGKWIPQAKTNTDYMHGYRWSQLTSIFNDPVDILKEFRDPPEGNLADVYRLRLGLPYIAAEDRLTEAQVYACCGQYIMTPTPGPCAMGVDVGKVKHVVIGVRSGNDQYKIIKVAAIHGTGQQPWDDIHDLAHKYKVKSTVIDIGPERDIVEKYRQDERGRRVFMCRYSDNPSFMRRWDTKEGIVSDYRTALFDETHRMVVTDGMLTIPHRKCPEVKEFVKQMCNAYKLLEVNKRTGARQYRYKGSNEHYRNALNYFLLAASKNRIARAGGGHEHRQEVAINEP